MEKSLVLLYDVGALLVYYILFGKRLGMLIASGLIVTRFFEQATGCESSCYERENQ